LLVGISFAEPAVETDQRNSLDDADIFREDSREYMKS
jgi:hypothetical protein